MLDKFIKVEAKRLFPYLFERDKYFHPTEVWRETVTPEALDDSWLESDTTYIYKVGTYIVSDDNKMDWLFAFYGYQRYENGGLEFLGYLHFPQGENDDMDSTFKSISNHITAIIRR